MVIPYRIVEKSQLPNEHPALFEVRKLLDEVNRLNTHFNAGQDAERRVCMKALTTLAGVHYTTPAEGYGTNAAWAIDDLCKCVKWLHGRLQHAAAGHMVASQKHYPHR